MLHHHLFYSAFACGACGSLSLCATTSLPLPPVPLTCLAPTKTGTSCSLTSTGVLLATRKDKIFGYHRKETVRVGVHLQSVHNCVHPCKDFALTCCILVSYTYLVHPLGPQLILLRLYLSHVEPLKLQVQVSLHQGWLQETTKQLRQCLHA
jgi:hypothetical protein